MADKIYNDGEIIFQEGDASTCAFVLKSGSIELFKGLGTEIVPLAILGPGDILGEMGILDNSPRSVTARAVGETTLRIIDRDNLLAQMRTNPDAAIKMLGRLAARLRQTNELLYQALRHNSGSLTKKDHEDGESVISKIFKRFRWSRPSSDIFAENSHTSHKPINGKPFTILVANLDGDAEELQATAKLHSLLNGIEGLIIKIIPQSLSIDIASTRFRGLKMAATRGRYWLAEEDAQLLLWGDVIRADIVEQMSANSPGKFRWGKGEAVSLIRLRFINLLGEVDSRPGGLLLGDHIDIPLSAEGEWRSALRAFILEGIYPEDEAGRQFRQYMLANDAAAMRFQGEPEGSNILHAQRAALFIVQANAMIATNSNQAKEALEIYREAVELVDSGKDLVEWWALKLHMAAALESLGHQNELFEAAECCQEALEAVTLIDAPQEWGATQYRLGRALFNLGEVTFDSSILKESLEANQAALQVYTRNSVPLRWGEIMNVIARTLILLSDKNQGAELLTRTIEICRTALGVLSPETAPFTIGALRNNLGSALFLIAKRSREPSLLDQSEAEFQAAIEVYKNAGAKQMVAVSEKNLARTRKTQTIRARNNVSGPAWWQVGDE